MQPHPDRLGPQVSRGPWIVAGATLIVLMLYSGRYGYHRDELYFIEAGRHPAWGYPDQPPLVPLLAASWDWIVQGHLWLFRLPPAIAAGLLAPIAAATCRRLGGDRRDQQWTAIIIAIVAFGVAVGHLFSTATFTYLLTAWTILLLIQALQRGTQAAWLGLGLVSGVSMQVQTLPAIMLACCLIALLLTGPRHALRTSGPYLAAGLFIVIAAPNLIYQATHGWPQFEVAADIAAGGSTSSVPRWLVIPSQLLIIGPLLSVVLLTGVISLLVSTRLRAVRWTALGYLVFLVVIIVTGGKAYYSSGFFPVIFAAGVPVLRRWIGSSRIRCTGAAVVLVAHAAGTALISLPLAPLGSGGFQVANAIVPDIGETAGWNEFARFVQRAAAGQPAGTIVLTSNYGEAGALDRARRLGAPLPPVYSGHNAYGEWGPPPDSATSAVVVGYSNPELTPWFLSCPAPVAFPGLPQVDNDEQRTPVVMCTGLRQSWMQLWPQIEHLG